MFAICTVMPEGILNVSVFSPYPLTNSGTLLNLTFTAADGVTSERHSTLDPGIIARAEAELSSQITATAELLQP